jgi:cytochrome c-type biogenesis protein CcmE
MNPVEPPEEKPTVNEAEVQRRKRQIWLITALMVLAFCMVVAVLGVLLYAFREQIRLFLTTNTGR